MRLAFTLSPHRTQHGAWRKPAARGRGGVVCAQASHAAEAGAAVLEAGGNAADAAVATAFALAAVEPWNSGLGGIGFAVVARPGESALTLDFGPVAPRRLDASAFPLTGRMQQDLFAWPEVLDERNIHGPLSFVIPAAVAGYAALARRFGRMPPAELLAPAEALAARGLPQDWFTLIKLAGSAAVLRRYPSSAAIYLPGGLPPVPPYQGDPGFLRLGALPGTLAQLRRAGFADFYTGEVAAQLLADFRGLGAVLDAADLAGCTALWRPALEKPWRGRTLHLADGLTAAPTLARVLEGMAAADFAAPTPSAGWYARLMRVMNAAYAERLAGLGEGEPRAAGSCTTHITVVDREGMMVAMTTTLLSSMGSRLVLPRSGVLMNNGVMWFDPRPGSANAIAPGRRPLCNMCPVIASQNGAPEIALGASGGRRILASVFQLLSLVADFGLDPEEAAHHPRIDVSAAAGVSADARLPEAVLDALREVGPVEVVEHGVLPVNFACPSLIRIGAEGERVGISDAMSPWSAAIAAG